MEVLIVLLILVLIFVGIPALLPWFIVRFTKRYDENGQMGQTRPLVSQESIVETEQIKKTREATTRIQQPGSSRKVLLISLFILPLIVIPVLIIVYFLIFLLHVMAAIGGQNFIDLMILYKIFTYIGGITLLSPFFALALVAFFKINKQTE